MIDQWWSASQPGHAGPNDDWCANVAISCAYRALDHHLMSCPSSTQRQKMDTDVWCTPGDYSIPGVLTYRDLQWCATLNGWFLTKKT